MAQANKFGTGYMGSVTGKMLDAAFKQAVRNPGQSLRELMDNLAEDNLQDEESSGLHRGGRLRRSPSGRWVRDGRIESG